MKIQFNKAFKDLEDNEVYEGGQTLYLHKTLAPVMAAQPEGVDVIKFFDWSRAIYKGEEIDLDRKDQETLKTFITNCKQLSVLSKGQLLDCFKREED